MASKCGSLVPWHVVGGFDHVIINRTGDGVEGVVADLRREDGKLLILDLFKKLLGIADGGVDRLVHTNDHLLESHGISLKSMLCGLSILRETGLEATNIVSSNEDSCISLGGTSAHVLDVISQTCGVNYDERILVIVELTESDINGDTTLAFSLQLVENPSALQKSLAGLGGLLLELLNGFLIDTIALLDQVRGGGIFARVKLIDDNEIYLKFFLGNRVLRVLSTNKISGDFT